MADTYATVDQYRDMTGDSATSAVRVAAMLEGQSAKLRSVAGIRPGRKLTSDQIVMCRELVCDAVRKACVTAQMPGFDGGLVGASSASFTANGLTQSIQTTNPSGTAYFDRSTLSALMRSLGTSAQIGRFYL